MLRGCLPGDLHLTLPASDSSPRVLRELLLASGVPFPEPRTQCPPSCPVKGADETDHDGSLHSKTRMAKRFLRGLSLAHEPGRGPAAPQASVSPYDTRMGRICLPRLSSLSVSHCAKPGVHGGCRWPGSPLALQGWCPERSLLVFKTAHLDLGGCTETHRLA